MQRVRKKITVFALMATTLLSGCAQGPFRIQYLWHDDPELSYYVDKASAIEYPTNFDEELPQTDPALFVAPRDLRSLEDVDPRAVTLNECVRMALQEAAVLRDDASFGSPSNPILSRPQSVPSTLDPAITQTGFLFGSRGIESALSEFDTLLQITGQWGRDEVPQNAATLGLTPGQTQTSETFGGVISLEKTIATGGTVSLQHSLNYDGNNRPITTQAFSSSFSGNLQAEVRHPLLAGNGVDVNQIAGPQNQQLRGVSGVSQGVLIARINQDISLTQFEQSVATLVRDVEQAYWDLQLYLRLYESETASFRSLMRYYDRVSFRTDVNNIVKLSAESRIFDAKARLKGSLADVIEREGRLRRLCNLPLNDGKFLYPADQPIEAELKPLWDATLEEALSNRVELRRQKWEIKSLELQLKAARNLARPRLDAVMQYRINALGDRLAGNHNTELDTYLGNLARNNNTGWSVGLQYSMPLGLRAARLQETNTELRLRKARILLRAQEEDIAFEVANAVVNMQRWYELANDSVLRNERAIDYVGAIGDAIDAPTDGRADVISLYQNLLDAEIQQRDAEQGYMQSIIEYNKALSNFRFRKGTTLSDNEIFLAEGNWHPAAMPIAMQRAVSRTYAKDVPKLESSTQEFVGGPAGSAWETVNPDTRPWIPGAMGTPEDGAVPGTAGQVALPNNEPGAPMAVPPAQEDAPAILPLPSTPTPEVAPPATEEPPAIIPQGQGDDITRQQLQNRVRGAVLAPVQGSF